MSSAHLLAVLAGWPLLAQPPGPIRPAGPSPRIEELKRRVSKGESGAVAAFWATLNREHTPIVEPFPGDRNQALLTLVWRGTPETKSVRVAGSPMERIASTDVWHVTFAVANDHPFAYSFTTDQGATPQPDPLNPRRFMPPVAQELPASAVNSESVYMNRSIAAPPGVLASPWVDPRAGVAAGRVEEYAYPSKIYGSARRVWIYHPPGDGAPPATLLICLWGRDYLNEIPAPTILENLLSQGKIPRLTALFVENDNDRFQNFQSTQRFAESFANELMPSIRADKRVQVEPGRTIIAGYSAAGLAAAFVAFKHPELIGNVLAQSGAFWRGFEGEGASEYEWLSAQYAAAPKQTTRFFLHVGSLEVRRAGGSAPVFIEANRRLRDVLVNRGYPVSYEEIPGAEHDFLHWRSKFADGLIYLTAGSPGATPTRH